MRLRVERHRPSTLLSRNGCDDTELTRPLLFHDGQGTLTAVGAEGQPPIGIEYATVATSSDGQPGEDLAVVCIEHDHRLATAASTEEPTVHSVQCQAGRALPAPATIG